MWSIRVKTDQNGSFLTHYGVKGMKWGVRKEYEPKGHRKNWKDKFNKQRKATVKTDSGDALIEYYDVRNTNVDKWLIDTLDNAGRYETRKQAAKILDALPKQKEKLSEDEQILATNHDGSKPIRLVNCFECSMAYEMRMRGYDVQAKEMNGGWNSEVLHAFAVKDGFDITINYGEGTSVSDKQRKAEAAYKQVEEECLAYGDGARGCLGIQYYDYDSGHSMYWKVENGKFRIIDSQQSGRDGYETFLHADTSKTISVYRLDNADVLPGVTDFVEPWAMTEEELVEQEALAKEKAAKLKTAKKQSDKKKAEKLRLADEKATALRDKEIQAGKSTFQKVVDKVSKTSKNLIKSGKNFILDIFNPQYKEFGGHKFKVKRK